MYTVDQIVSGMQKKPTFFCTRIAGNFFFGTSSSSDISMYLRVFAAGTAGSLSIFSSSVSVSTSLDFAACFNFARGTLDLDLVRRLVRLDTLDFGDTLNFLFFGVVRPDS